MEYWNPIFSRIVDSSIWLEPDFVRIVFVTMLAKKDYDHVCRGSAFQISRWSNKTEAETLEALRILSEPDKRRVEPQPHEGRRIQKVLEGWLILNGEVYQNLMRGMNRREYKTKWQRDNRNSAKTQIRHGMRKRRQGNPLPGEQGSEE
jgi:hypothetical protein